MACFTGRKCFPNRSKSTGGLTLALRLVVQMQKPMMRSRSMPALLCKSQQHCQEQVKPRNSLTSIVPVVNTASIPPPLCRWSSAPPSDQMINNSSSHSTDSTEQMIRRRRSLMAPPTKPLRYMMNMATIKSLPPRLPNRKSGKGAELRSALPPRVPQRKPGEATIEAKALPPFMPRRCPMDDSCDNLSLVSTLTMGSAAAHIDEDDTSDGESSLSDLLPICFGSLTSSSENPTSVRHNLREVLGHVLDNLDDSLCDGDLY
ncbi:expressed unknown protein [Seminavis robusta]|uniref:Uncharacterized protein n=1 Tax=Seminavis robusta TaxID=568900 RepID=A0A9N8E4X2_9STRA|nr:expressed unknown protein [Seminavis robusta]|eukprot:Sro663_g183470.1 n/a (260) ;mRNA; f:16835-17614